MAKWNRDCKSFPGIYACDIMKSESYKDCNDCKFYEPISKKILIIKLGAMGDVLRTTPILYALKEKYKDAQITWLVKEEAKELLKNNHYIDRLWIYNFETALRLEYEHFDILINLEIAPPATVLANKVNAKEKFGCFLDKDGHPNCFNQAAKYYLERAFSDYKNRNNRRTYLEMMFGIIELPYNKQDLILNINNKEFENKFKKENKITEKDKVIGINIGSDKRWPSKAISKEKIIELIKKIQKENDYKIILLAGPQEIEKQEEIIKEVEVLYNDPNNTLKEFSSIINICHLIITGDTLALHLATALKKKVIALFFCTPPWEVEDYNRIKKIVSPLLDKYFYCDYYNEELVNSISTNEILEDINYLFNSSKINLIK